MLDQTTDLIREELLLHEYQVTSTRVDNLTSLIWQTLTVFLGLSGLGLGILAQTGLDTPNHIMLAFVLALAVTFTLRWWNKVANKWGDHQDAMYGRLKDIEAVLDLSTNLNINQRDQQRKAKGASVISIRTMRNQLILGVSAGWNFYIFLLGLTGVLNPTSVSWSVLQELIVIVATLVSLGIALWLLWRYPRDELQRQTERVLLVSNGDRDQGDLDSVISP